MVLTVAHPVISSVVAKDAGWLRTIGDGRDCVTTRFDFTAGSSNLVGLQHLRASSGFLAPARMQTDIDSEKNTDWLFEQFHAGSTYEELTDARALWAPAPQQYFKGRGCIHSVGYGWPFVSLATDYVFFTPNQPASVYHGIPIGLGVDISSGIMPLPRAVPLRVNIAGFAGNAGLFTIAVLLVMMGITQVRNSRFAHKRAWRKGRCANCGYHVGSRDRCSECGEKRPDHLSG